MPRLWLDYLKFLMDQRKITLTRRTFDRALRSLPPTQHNLIWKLYSEFVHLPFVPAVTAVTVFKRQMKVCILGI